MKKIILCILFFLSLNFYGQVYKNRAIEVAYKSMNDNGSWTTFSDWKECNIIIVTDLDKNMFTIYSEEIQEFDIIKFYPAKIDEKGYKTYEMFCIDKNGKKCQIRNRFLNGNNYAKSQLYVDYNDVIIVYNLQ